MNELNKHFGVDESLRTLAQTCSLELTRKHGKFDYPETWTTGTFLLSSIFVFLSKPILVSEGEWGESKISLQPTLIPLGEAS